MSSHHIVREDQEPAVIVLTPDLLLQEKYHQLLEWSPTIICDFSAARALDSYGIKVDVIVDSNTHTFHQSHISFIPLESTVLETAIDFLWRSGRKQAYVLSEAISLGLMNELANQELGLTILTQEARWMLIRKEYAKWYRASELLEVLSNSSYQALGAVDAIGDNSFQTRQDGIVRIIPELNTWLWLKEMY